MIDLAGHPITWKRPARHPDRLQLYPLPTPNGVEVRGLNIPPRP